jgi:hypothetical protein
MVRRGDQAELDQQSRRVHRHDAAAAVIGAAVADVPGVDVAADDDDLVGQLAAADLCDRVAADGVGQQPGAERELHGDLLAAGDEAGEQLGVLERQRGRGELRHALGVAQGAGVRRAQARGGDRADQHRLRADPGRLHDPDRADRHGGAVAGLLVLVIEGRHRLIDHHDLAAQRLAPGGDLRERLDHRDLAAQGAPGADRAAEAEDHQRSLDRPDHPRTLGAAHPVRHHHLLAARPGQPVLAHRRDRPVDRPLERPRTTQPVAEFVRQRPQPLIAAAPTHRRARQLLRRSHQHLRQHRRRR